MGRRGMATPAKIAVITGAGSGIGRASAHCLLEDGWTVVLAGRRKNMLEETAALGGFASGVALSGAQAPPRTLVVPTDVADPVSIAALFEAVEAEAGVDGRHAANALRYRGGLPLEANVQFMTVMATKMPYIGRG